MTNLMKSLTVAAIFLFAPTMLVVPVDADAAFSNNWRKDRTMYNKLGEKIAIVSFHVWAENGGTGQSAVGGAFGAFKNQKKQAAVDDGGDALQSTVQEALHMTEGYLATDFEVVPVSTFLSSPKYQKLAEKHFKDLLVPREGEFAMPAFTKKEKNLWKTDQLDWDVLGDLRKALGVRLLVSVATEWSAGTMSRNLAQHKKEIGKKNEVRGTAAADKHGDRLGFDLNVDIGFYVTATTRVTIYRRNDEPWITAEGQARVKSDNEAPIAQRVSDPAFREELLGLYMESLNKALD